MEEKTAKQPVAVTIAITVAIAVALVAFLGIAAQRAPVKPVPAAGIVDVGAGNFMREVAGSQTPVYLQFYTIA